MEKFQAFVEANAKSWTVRLGVLVSILVAVAQYLPQVQGVISAVWPASAVWLVPLAMWLGRAIGLVKALQSATNALQGK